MKPNLIGLKCIKRIMSKLRNLASAVAQHFPATVVRTRYFLRFKKFPNLKNPQNLNEKILHQKLYSDTSRWTVLADKIRVREYVKECGLEEALIPLYGAWKSADEIPFEELPEEFMLKSNNGDGRGTFLAVRNKSKLTETEISKIRAQVDRWLSAQHIGALSAEPQYKDIPPMVMAEKLLPFDKKNGSIIDYKLWCFCGKPHSFFVCIDRKSDGGHASVNCYDLEWNAHPERMNSSEKYPLYTQPIPCPNGLQDMIRYAKILSKPFPQVRVDFYEVDGKVYFGELTFSSLGGMITWYKPWYLMEKGNLVDLKYNGES